jgi:hypothetical protein
LAAEGAAGMEDAAAAGLVSAAGAAATFSTFSAAAGALAPAEPLAEIWPSRPPGATVSPAAAVISDRTPAAGAGTSIVTLSVSSSQSGSSALMTSPTFLNQVPTVASLTDSPRVCSVRDSYRGYWEAGRINRPARPRGKQRAAPCASTSGLSPARLRPDDRCSARAGTWRRYGRAPIRDRGR